MKYTANLDKNFRPIGVELDEFLKTATRPFSFVLEDGNGYNFRYDFKISNDYVLSYMFAERILKSLLWIVGGRKVYVKGCKRIANKLGKAYSKTGKQAFDVNFMEKVFGMPFEIVSVDVLPEERRQSISAGGYTDGCRIGFDAGGSDRKVSAVIDGEAVFSEEVVWFPKLNADPQYHLDGIIDAFKRAQSKMPRVDAIGVSSAGIYIDNRTAVASLFLKVPDDKYDAVREIYINAAKAIGDNIPLEVANDGDVTAIAGAMSLGDNEVLGIAMGTSEAGGYVNKDGGINGWLTELAFVPCDVNPNSMIDEWSGDYGTGVKYFSQDAVIKLAEYGGYQFPDVSPAEKLKIIQKLMEDGDKLAHDIYQSIGVYFGYTIPYYAKFYSIKYVLALGRVLSGKGGDLIVETAQRVLDEEYPALDIKIVTPDEKFKRLGQSVIAASLPKIK